MCTFSLPKWRTARKSHEARERKSEGYKRLSRRKHGVSLSSHMWNCLSGQSDALTEINQSDIAPTFVTAQQCLFSHPLSFSVFFFVSVLLRAPCHCEYRHLYCSPDSCLPLSLSYYLSYPISCCVSTDYQCNTSNKVHQPTTLPPSHTHTYFICTGSENQRRRVIWDKKKMDVPPCEQHAQEPSLQTVV